MADHAFLRPHGGYRRLRSFQVTEIIYDATKAFCDRHIDLGSRTHDQMVQAARSGRQNIAEGSRASATSSKSELYLVNIARSSLDELLLDYEDYLRQRKLPKWDKDDARAAEVRAVGKTGAPDAAAYGSWLEHKDPAVIANALICLIHQANYLLDRQIHALEQRFIRDGGYGEALYRARAEERQRQNQTDPTAPTDQAPLACPKCGKAMLLRTAHKGRHAGSQFWGCSGYPECKGTRPCDKSDRSA